MARGPMTGFLERSPPAGAKTPSDLSCVLGEPAGWRRATVWGGGSGSRYALCWGEATSVLVTLMGRVSLG